MRLRVSIHTPLEVAVIWQRSGSQKSTRVVLHDLEHGVIERKDYVFGKVDTEAEPEIAGFFGIQAIPTLIIFRDGIGVYQESGSLPPRALDEVLQAAKALDMNEVRAELERDAQKPADDTPWELQED